MTFKDRTDKPEGLVVQVLRLNKIAGTASPHFRVVIKGSQGREIHFGSEEDIRKGLAKAGVPAIDLGSDGNKR